MPRPQSFPPRHNRDRGTEQSSPAAEGLVRSESLSLFPRPDKQGNRRLAGSSNVSLQD